MACYLRPPGGKPAPSSWTSPSAGPAERFGTQPNHCSCFFGQCIEATCQSSSSKTFPELCGEKRRKGIPWAKAGTFALKFFSACQNLLLGLQQQRSQGQEAPKQQQEVFIFLVCHFVLLGLQPRVHQRTQGHNLPKKKPKRSRRMKKKRLQRRFLKWRWHRSVLDAFSGSTQFQLHYLSQSALFFGRPSDTEASQTEESFDPCEHVDFGTKSPTSETKEEEHPSCIRSAGVCMRSIYIFLVALAGRHPAVQSPGVSAAIFEQATIWEVFERYWAIIWGTLESYLRVFKNIYLRVIWKILES